MRTGTVSVAAREGGTVFNDRDAARRRTMVVIQKAYETELSISADGSEVIISQEDHYGEQYAVSFPPAHLDALIKALQKMKAEFGDA